MHVLMKADWEVLKADYAKRVDRMKVCVCVCLCL